MMTDTDQLLKNGLIAMSKSMENGFWLHGHVGAEILTNTFFVLEFAPNESLKAAILERIQHLLKSKSAYFDQHLLTNQTKSDISQIEMELDKCTSKLSTAGHGVIFGTLILKAIRLLDGWLPGEVNDGVISLLINTQSDDPNRYYGHPDYQNTAIDLSGIPDFETADEAAHYSMVHQDYYESQELNGQFYHFHGNQIHDITHANALVMLDEMGYHEMVKKGIPELRKQIKLGQAKLPNGEKYLSKTNFNPFDPSFWLRDVEDEHHFKLAYAVIYLLDRYDDLNHDETFEKLSGHWELMG